jgi:hypothetical protein
MDEEKQDRVYGNWRVKRRKVEVAEVQAKYRQGLLMILPVMGIFIAGESLLTEAWNPIRVGLFLFFVGFLGYRVFLMMRKK